MSRLSVMQPMDEAAASGRVAVQGCVACGRDQYPPRELCGVCLSADLTWKFRDSVDGTMLAVSALHHSQELEFRSALPLGIGLVRLDFGASAMCFVQGADSGARVRVRASLDAHDRAVLTAEIAP
jgi:uncharacterized OB-fold protein